MSIRCYRLSLLAAIAIASLAASPLAAACDAPGTPNNETLQSIGPGMLSYSFDNTARISLTSHPNGPLKVRVFFDMNMKERGSGGDWTYIENDGPHPLGYQERIEFKITTQQTRHINPANLNGDHTDRRLVAKKTYCMRVWARTDGGCRSDQSSSWKCATVSP